MSIKALENLVKTGQLKKEPPNAAEIQRLFAQAKNRFKDAAVKGVSVEGRFIAAYDAAYSAALAAMRWHGIQQHAFALALRQALGER